MIRLEDLSFRYRPDQPYVVEELSHTFSPGTSTAITGPSGSGKSTLLYLIGLMITPSSGRIMVDGEEVSGMPDFARSQFRAKTTGFVFQDAMLDPSRSILDNVLEGSLFARTVERPVRRAHELLERFGVTENVKRRPGEISGGQAQRVALCRALLKDPRIILADEPSGNLDEDSANIVWSALHDLRDQGKTVIVVTHDHARAATCENSLTILRAA